MNANQQQHILQALASALAPIIGQQTVGPMTVPALYTEMLPAELMGAPRDFFTYGVDFLAIAAAGGTQTQTFTVQNDSDFLIVGATGTVVDPAAEETARPTSSLTIQIRDSGSGRELQNRAAGFGNLVGTGQLPAYWPFPKFIDRASDVSTTIVNNDTANPIRVRLNYIGFKIFSFNG